MTAQGAVDDREVPALLSAYAQHPLFHPGPVAVDNPYRRRLDVPAKQLDLQPCALGETLASVQGLFLNRVLLTIYERDFVLLPKQGFADKLDDFGSFYGAELEQLGRRIRPSLERALFAPLHATISIQGTWTIERFRAYYEHFCSVDCAASHQRLTQRIAKLTERRAGLRFYLIQAACDFLVESSAMAMNALGNYGPIQSELFKVVIDECGYGVDRTRHSTLYQFVLESVGLDSTAHTYWSEYLPATLYGANYYNYLSRNHARLFRYFGALLHVESCFRITTGHMADMMREIVGTAAEVRYFEEHTHIDRHHSRMALENIVVPSAERFGAWALQEMLCGFEESRAVGSLYTEALLRQVDWMFEIEAGATEADQPPNAGPPLAQARLDPGSTSAVQVFPRPVQVHCTRGRVSLHATPQHAVRVEAGMHAGVPQAAAFSLSTDEGCDYHIV